MKTYKMRHAKVGPEGAKHDAYALTVPVSIARLLTASSQTEFTCELTEDGLLFKPAQIAATKLPSWMRDPDSVN